MLASAAAFGQISFNSLYSGFGGTENIAPSAALGSGGPLGASFSVGSNATTLGQIYLSLENPLNDDSSFTVSLETDNNISPSGTVLASQVVSESLVAGNSTIIQVDLSPVLLSANTRYWVVLSGDSTDVTWDYGTDVNGPGVSSEYYSDNSGVTANNFYSEPFLMEVTPEPSSLAYLGLGILPFLLRRRKKS